VQGLDGEVLYRSNSLSSPGTVALYELIQPVLWGYYRLAIDVTMG
jgi:hypothetical protein